MFLGILFLLLSRLIPCKICMHHRSEICAPVGFDDDEVTKIHMQASRFLYVEDVGAAAFETDDIKWLDVMTCICIEAKLSSVRVRVNICLAERAMGLLAGAATHFGASKVLGCKIAECVSVQVPIFALQDG